MAFGGRRWRLARTLRERRPLFALDAVRQFQLSLFGLLALVGLGTAGYVWLEGARPLDAFYMTVITLTTVGFGEVVPLSDTGRLFTVALIVLGVGGLAYAVRNAAEIALGDRLWLSLGERAMEHRLETIRDHFIVCGYGRMGREIVNEFERRGERFVIVDPRPSLHSELLTAGIPHIIGDATQDEILLRAGIVRARGVISAVSGDADNVMVVLSAKGLNPSLKVVARAATVEIEKKLRRAGADIVTSPYVMGGQRMALAMVRPAVYQFLNNVVYNERQHIEMGEVVVRDGSALAGRTLRECDFRRRWAASVVAILEPGGQTLISPDPNRRLTVGETLIVVAPSQNLHRLEEIDGP